MTDPIDYVYFEKREDAISFASNLDLEIVDGQSKWVVEPAGNLYTIYREDDSGRKEYYSG